MSLLAVTSGSSGSSLVAPEGTEFDGVTDYLSINTYLSGGVATKTFTFSCFVYNATSSETRVVAEFLGDLGAGYNIFRVIVTENNIQLIGYNQSTSIILNCSVSTGNAPKNSWYNFICSVDLSNSSKRHMYINDVSKGVFDTFTNDSIAFNKPSLIYIGKPVPNNGNLNFKGRLSHIYLDYTYRDLSIEANRRLFITADGKPTPTATLKALNPILYLPMKDAATAHINEGTGGNFVQNGTLDTASRGANQDNCCAMLFDAYESLNKTNATQTIGHTKLTMSFSFKYTGYMPDQSRFIFCQGVGSTSGIDTVNVRATKTSITLVTRIGYDECFNATIYGINLSDRMHHVVLSIDRTNSLIRCSVNGILKTVTLNKGYSTTYRLPASTTWIGSENNAAGGSAFDLHGALGELYFDTKYIDLSTSNPFWDSVENKPKPVRQVIAETGVVPLIAMPLDASNAGKNYGTGGDFVANSAPYVGARGGSEYWQRTAKFDGSTSYLSKAGLDGIVDSKQLTFVANVYKTASTLYHLAGTTNSSVSISINASNQLVITAKNAGGTTIISATVTTTIANNTWTEIMVSLDLSNSANRSAYLNGALATVTWTTYTNDLIDFTVDGINVGADISNGNKFNGSMFLMLDNTYIDFSSEVNRLKYYDGLGYPKDLSLLINKPALLLNFNDVSNLGLNSGYGGNMTLNGALVSGSDVLG